ncbi:hypothetical protein ABBQ32_004840 [Trebouxia sp. C0010 RCD-2024]
MKKLLTHTASTWAPSLLQQQLLSQSECISMTAEGSPSLAETQQWSLPSEPPSGLQLASQLGSPTHTTDADTPLTPLHHTGARLSATSGFGLPDLSTADMETWPSDCPPDVDQLLDWVAESELPLSLSTAETTPSAFSMAGSPSPDCSLPLCSSPSMEGFDRQLSCSWDTDASHLDVQAYFSDIPLRQAESYSDALACSLLPDLEAVDAAVDAAASQQLLLPSTEDMPAQSSGQGTKASGDALDQLMEIACCSLPEAAGSLPEAVGQSSNAAPVLGMDLSLAGHDSSQAGACKEGQGSQKKRCGRPRVYDLDSPVATGAAKGSSTHTQVKGRGAKPKYICSTPEEAIVNR